MDSLDMIVVGLALVVLVLRFTWREITVKDGDDTYIRELSWNDRLSLLVNGHINIGLRANYTPHFIFRCKAHGYVVDYPHGYEDELRCPECTQMLLKKGKKDDVMSPL